MYLNGLNRICSAYVNFRSVLNVVVVFVVLTTQLTDFKAPILKKKHDFTTMT